MSRLTPQVSLTENVSKTILPTLEKFHKNNRGIFYDSPSIQKIPICLMQ